MWCKNNEIYALGPLVGCVGTLLRMWLYEHYYLSVKKPLPLSLLCTDISNTMHDMLKTHYTYKRHRILRSLTIGQKTVIIEGNHVA